MPASLSRETSRKTWLTSVAGAFAVALALTGTAWTDEVYSLKNVIPIPGAPLVSFDISWTDPILQRYYLGDRSNKAVDSIDLNTNAVTQFQPGFIGFTGNNDTSGPDGVMTIDDGNVITLWVGDGQSRVWVLDPRTGGLADTSGAPNPIPTSPVGTNPRRADELCFDPVDHLVMVANNADDPPFASIISTTSFTVVKKIPFDGTNGAPNSNNGAEQCGWSPRTGKFYISIPGIVGQLPDGTAGGVAVIDPKTLSVVTTFLVPPDACEQPQGLAVGPAPQIMLGCNQPSPNGAFNTAIIDENNGNVIAALPNEGGNDEVWFNPSDGH
jgi:hypothetical protein